MTLYSSDLTRLLVSGGEDLAVTILLSRSCDSSEVVRQLQPSNMFYVLDPVIKGKSQTFPPHPYLNKVPKKYTFSQLPLRPRTNPGIQIKKIAQINFLKKCDVFRFVSGCDSERLGDLRLLISLSILHILRLGD